MTGSIWRRVAGPSKPLASREPLARWLRSWIEPLDRRLELREVPRDHRDVEAGKDRLFRFPVEQELEARADEVLGGSVLRAEPIAVARGDRDVVLGARVVVADADVERRRDRLAVAWLDGDLGHGSGIVRAARTLSGYRFVDLARDVDAVANAFGATVAVGTSLGAGALGNLVCRVPDRFERMVWLLPAGLDRPFTLADRYQRLAGDLEGKTPQEALDAVLNDPQRVARYLETPWRLEFDRVLWEHGDPDGLARAIRGAVTDFPIPDRELLREVRIPTLIVSIKGDEVHLAEVAHILADLMPNAELIAFDDQEDLLRQIPALVQRVSAFIGEAA